MNYPLSQNQIDTHRPVPFYFITTNDPAELSYDAFYASLLELRKEGFGGIVLFNKPQGGFTEEEYLGEVFFRMVRNAAEACRDLGLSMWLNDAYDFPPGAVAGKIRKAAPTLCQRYICLSDGRPEVRTADWGFPAFEEDLSGELFRKFVHEEYLKHLGDLFGDPIIGFFSDTDNRRVLPRAMYDTESPMRNYFPWSSDFESAFRARYGYEIMPYMKAVLKRESIPEARDYWEFAGLLYQKWWRGNSEWLHEHGLLYTGHSSDTSPYLQTEAPRSSCFTEGRFSDAQRYFDYPGTDQELYAIDGGKHMVAAHMYCPKVIWGEEAPAPKMTAFSDMTQDLRAKQAASTAFLYGKKGVMCEMFAASNYGAEPSVLRHIAAYQIMQGVTFIVPHAYHHRSRGAIKYFAPPAFGPHALLRHSADVLNEEFARLTAMMSLGKMLAPVALLDPTEYVWMNRYDRKAYFDAFARLNRLPYGFVICDAKKLIWNDYGFQAAVYAGIELPDEVLCAIERKGIRVLSADEIGALQELVPTDVQYEGEGTPHFQRRLIDGEEFTFIANIESEEPVKGVLRAYGRTKELLLYPGEIRYVSKSFDDIPGPAPGGTEAFRLPEFLPVTFDRPNCIPLEYFTSDGRTVTKTGDDREIRFTFVSEGLEETLKLWIPASSGGIVAKVLLNGKEACGIPGEIFDEAYTVYAFPVTEGENTLTILKNGAFRPYDRLLLTGEFDAEIRTDRSFYRKAFQTYNLSLYIPEHAEAVLRKRRAALSIQKSLALQGQPFYSGAVTYRFRTAIEKASRYRLHFPKVRDVMYLTVNGKPMGKRVLPPYTFEFELEQGGNEIRMTVIDSFANAMECYLEPAGILRGGVLEKC